MSLIGQAAEMALLCHAGQRRKYTGEPYIVHPAEDCPPPQVFVRFCNQRQKATHFFEADLRELRVVLDDGACVADDVSTLDGLHVRVRTGEALVAVFGSVSRSTYSPTIGPTFS